MRFHLCALVSLVVCSGCLSNFGPAPGTSEAGCCVQPVQSPDVLYAMDPGSDDIIWGPHPHGFAPDQPEPDETGPGF